MRHDQAHDFLTGHEGPENIRLSRPWESIMYLLKPFLLKLFILFALAGFAFQPTLVSAADDIKEETGEAESSQSDDDEEPDCE